MSKDYYIIPIFVPQEGCPHKCVFCNQDRITGCHEEIVAKDVYNIIDEYLETITNRKATIEVSFFGGTFTGIKESKQKELLQVALEYKDRGIIHKIRMSTRPDYISKYILDYLKEYKVDIIELGVQSLDEEVLRASGRGHSVEEVYRASKLIKEYGITLGHQIMPGLPLDNFTKDIETVKKSLEMNPDMVRIYPALVIKDTPMETMFLRGDYIPYTLEEAVEISARMYELYKEKEVLVIRMGLQPTEAINEGGDIVSGPFHPAFRELVESYLMCQELRGRLNKNVLGKVELNSRDLSKLYANKKMYFNKLKEEGYFIEVKVTDSIEKGTLIIK